MTGLRRGEVDLVNGWLKIPAERMKAGLPHDMPLSDEALAILRRRLGAALPDPGALVFPSRNNKPIDSWARIAGHIRKALGQCAAKNPDDPTRRAEAFSWHDLRRALGTHLASQSTSTCSTSCWPTSRRRTQVQTRPISRRRG